MTNATQDYNAAVRAGLPTGMTYSDNRYRYDGRSFFSYTAAYWYWLYMEKLGSPPQRAPRF